MGSDSFSAPGFLALLFAIAIAIALAFFASPLIALVVALVLGGVLLAGLVFRERGGREPTQGAQTAAGKPASPTGSRSGGAPVSGEGR